MGAILEKLNTFQILYFWHDSWNQQSYSADSYWYSCDNLNDPQDLLGTKKLKIENYYVWFPGISLILGQRLSATHSEFSLGNMSGLKFDQLYNSANILCDGLNFLLL